MKHRFTVHTHTDAVDGHSCARAMIESAIARGMTAVGFAEHAVQKIDPRYGLTDAAEKHYIEELQQLKAEYADRIIIRCGIERDAFSHCDRTKFEYVLGSAHYIQLPDERILTVDGDPERWRAMVEENFAGDVNEVVRRYYDALATYIEDYRPEVIGHFDLVTKYNDITGMIDTGSAVYQRAALESLERCCKAGGYLEINTGAISRGYRKDPYPAIPLLQAWREMGGDVTIGTDSHHESTVDAAFDLAVEWAKKAGFRSIKALGAKELFVDWEI